MSRRTSRDPRAIPIGLHRVLDAGRRAAAGGRAARHPPRAVARRGPDPRRAAQPRRRVASASSQRKHGGDGDAVRAEVLEIVAARGKMQNPGDRLRRHAGRHRRGGRPASRRSGSTVGDRVATLVSLTLTPLVIRTAWPRWDGRSEQVPVRRVRDPVRPLDRRRAPRRPADRAGAGRDGRLRRAGADRPGRRRVRRPRRRRRSRDRRRRQVRLAVAWPPPRRPAPAARSASCPHQARGRPARRRGARRRRRARRRPRPGRAARRRRPTAGGPADVTVVCVDVPGCERGAILATAEGGTVIFFSMATSFSAAALGAEGLAADVTMLVGNGYVPGHADYALDLLRSEPTASGSCSRRRLRGSDAMTRHPVPRRRRVHGRPTRAPPPCCGRGRPRSPGSATTTAPRPTTTAPTRWSTSTARSSPPPSSTPTCTPSAPASR